MHACMHVYICMHACMHVYICMHLHACMHVYICMHYVVYTEEGGVRGLLESVFSVSVRLSSTITPEQNTEIDKLSQIYDTSPYEKDTGVPTVFRPGIMRMHIAVYVHAKIYACKQLPACMQKYACTEMHAQRCMQR